MAGRGTEICKVPIFSENHMIGKTLEEAALEERTGADIIAVVDKGEFIISPDKSYVINDGTVIIALGTREQLEESACLANCQRNHVAVAAL